MGLLFLSQHLLRLHRLGSGHRLSPRLLLVDDLFQEGWGRRCGAFLLRWHSIHLLFESAQTFDWLIALHNDRLSLFFFNINLFTHGFNFFPLFSKLSLLLL